MSDEGKLFVGGLSFDTIEDSLAEAFSKYGAIKSVAVIRDRDSGHSRGFGFVTYENPDDAKDALEAMNGKDLDGRCIRVDEAGNKSGSRQGSGQQGGGFGRGGRGYYRGGRYNSDRSYGGDRGYGSGDRSFGGGQYRSSGSGYSNYRDNNRGQGGYSERSSYRDNHDRYAEHE